MKSNNNTPVAAYQRCARPFEDRSRNDGVRLRPVDVHGLFIELEDTFRLRNKKSGICICYHRRTTECGVKADRNRLVQVMMNLMNNAVKFTGEGSIEFGFDVREDGFLHFYVTDTGCGIPEERLEEIFGNLSNSTAL